MFGQYGGQFHGRTTMTKSFSVRPGQKMVGKPKKIENNTFRWQREDGATVIRLHFTDIIIKHENGDVELNSGGFKTMTTKDRLNRYLEGYEVYTNRGIWYVREHGTGRTTIFRDGMVLPRDMETDEDLEKEQLDLAKRIKRFVDTLDEMDELPMPSHGDCWYCLIHTENGQSLGDATNNTGHLLYHIEEGYLHGSLLLNAMRFAGWNDERIGLEFHYGRTHKRERRNIKNALRRYLRAKLGLAN